MGKGKRVAMTAAGRSNADWWGAAAFVAVMLVIGLLVDGWLCAGISYAAASALAVGVLAMVTHRRGVERNRRRWTLIGGTVGIVIITLGISQLLMPGTVAHWVLGVEVPRDVKGGVCAQDGIPGPDRDCHPAAFHGTIPRSGREARSGKVCRG